MPIRRVAGTPPQETAPSAAPEGEPDASSEESASVGGEEPDAAAAAQAPAATEEDAPVEEEAGEGQPEENGEKEEGEDGEQADESTGEKKEKKGKEAEKKEEKDEVKEKPKKPMKRTVPAWATLSASKKVVITSKFAGNQPKVDDILFEAIESCKEKSGASAPSVMKYIVKKYPSLELDKRKFLLKKALQRQVEKGTIKQLKGKGFSGSFKIGTQPRTPAAKKSAVTPGMKADTLGDALPLIITRLCEPKEASYILIKKYVEQHFPQFNVENRPDILKAALVRAVEKGHLEQITGKGASGTFQLKRTGDKILLKGGPLDDAILTAITAMNEPKTCSITTLRKHLVETNKDSVEYRVVNTLKKTLQKCKMMGWMEQITGNGLTGTYQLSYPYYPSPAVLFPDKHKESKKLAEKEAEKPKRKRRAGWSDESSEEEEEEEETDDSEDEDEESEDDEPPPPKRKAVKKPPTKARRPPPSKKSRPASQSKAKGKRRAPAKKTAPPAKKPAAPVRKAAPPPAKKPVTPAKKPAAASKPTPSKKAAPPPPPPPPPVKVTPVKKAAPASKPKTPVVKKLTSRASKRPAPKKLSPAKPAAKSPVKAKPAARKSARGRK